MWTDRGREGGIEKCGQTGGERGNRGMWTDRGREGKREMGTDRLRGIGRGGGR